MALPSLGGLRLGDRPDRPEEEAETSQWVRFNEAECADLPAEERRERENCPVELERFRDGQWIWHATREENGQGLFYYPEAYFRSLQTTKGQDPTTRQDVPAAVIRDLAQGEPTPDGEGRQTLPGASAAAVASILSDQQAARERREGTEAVRVQAELRRRAYALIDQFGAEAAVRTVQEAANHRQAQAQEAAAREAREAAEAAAAAARVAMEPARAGEGPLADDGLEAVLPREASINGASASELIDEIAPRYPLWWLPVYARDFIREAERVRAGGAVAPDIRWMRPMLSEQREDRNVMCYTWRESNNSTYGVVTASMDVRSDTPLGRAFTASERRYEFVSTLASWLRSRIIAGLPGASSDEERWRNRRDILNYIKDWLPTRDSTGRVDPCMQRMLMVEIDKRRLHLGGGRVAGVYRISIHCHQQFLRWLNEYCNSTSGLVNGDMLVRMAANDADYRDPRGFGPQGLETLTAMMDEANPWNYNSQNPRALSGVSVERIRSTVRFWRSAYDAMHDMMSCCIGLLHARAVTEEGQIHTLMADLNKLQRRFGVITCRFEPLQERPIQSARDVRLSPEHPADRPRFEVAATTRMWYGLTRAMRDRLDAAEA